jgi:hypothetical protein
MMTRIGHGLNVALAAGRAVPDAGDDAADLARSPATPVAPPIAASSACCG